MAIEMLKSLSLIEQFVEKNEIIAEKCPAYCWVGVNC